MKRHRDPDRRSRDLWQIFRWPIALALTSALGLVSALIGDGSYDALSWLMLALPAVTIIAALWLAGRGGRTR